MPPAPSSRSMRYRSVNAVVNRTCVLCDTFVLWYEEGTPEATAFPHLRTEALPVGLQRTDNLVRAENDASRCGACAHELQCTRGRSFLEQPLARAQQDW